MAPISTSALREPIVVVGSACRLAGGCNSPSKLWNLLQKPQDVRSEIPEDRFSLKGYYHPNGAQHGHMNVKTSYLLDEDPRLFDAEFFGINPVEASAMDPQQRLLLETVYEAVEAAGMTIEGLRGSDTAVYAGLMCGDYDSLLLRDPDRLPTYTAVGTSRAVLSNRVSYFFDWHGPSITMDTACSSSLVAVHQAVQTLRAGESRVAVACGSNLILGPEMYIIESKVKMLSPDGLSRMWDKDANGYARGEGVAAVLLKTLSQARADGDDIECVIRETGVNQDGATGGITVPNAAAQRALIQSVYSKAGLDPLNNSSHRPQYIEAHGTGTPAGDPVEAEALSSAFFRAGEDSSVKPVYTGSVKTILGHTEGTAGLAGLLKVSEALRNATIPPNLLFNELAPKVAPFYGNLQIPTTAMPWPEIPDGQPKRASVNNFGFGGTNAHAILESYSAPARAGASQQSTQFTPFVFSAASEVALRANLTAYAAYLEAHPDVPICDLAYTLRERRSVFPHRAAFAGETIEQLRANIGAALDESDSPIGTRMWRRTGETCRLLGIFTGQGAQYARMGAGLIEKSTMASRIIEELEQHLADLGSDSPSWSLRAELMADASQSRVGEAAISQPLCTAVQIMMVDLLAAANIHFDTVVGHSSGEIAAAYAAGYLSARDAMVVAYLRGVHCKHAASPNGETIRGAMMAAGISLEDATELCDSEEMDGRVSVAACNSSTSVTLSGDEDAIEELAVLLDDEKKFNRRLRVDQAYHSRHMLSCSESYIVSLRQAGVKVQQDRGSRTECTWYSSVFDGRPIDPSSHHLSDEYWAQNMTMPVLFAQATRSALSTDTGVTTFAAVVEVGAHPALAGPASQNISEVLNDKLPYFGTLSRTVAAPEAFATCLGGLWCHLDPVAGTPSLGHCEVAMSDLAGASKPFRVLKALPAYQWKHEARYWAESRRSRKLRLRERPFHPLLGDVSPDSAAHVLRWKNVLKPVEMPWVQGHQVQNQIVLPAAAYVSSAIEAAQFLVSDDKRHTIQLIELSSFHIQNPIMFDGEDTGVEVQIELSQVTKVSPRCITAGFVYSAALGGDNAELELAASGEVRIVLSDMPTPDLLPKRQLPPPHVIPVDPDRLYDFMASLEYNFSGPFRSLTTLERKLGKACCVARKARTSTLVPDDGDDLLVHPVDLDAAFQSVMLAYSYPGDDQLRLLHLPTSISKVRVNPAVLRSTAFQTDDFIAVDSVCNAADRAEPGSGFSGGVSMYVSKAEGPRRAAVQVDHVKFKPVGSSASNDRNVFYNMHWVLARPDGNLAADKVPLTAGDKVLMFVLSRIAAFYLRQFDETVPADSVMRTQGPECYYLQYARHMTNLLKTGQHQWAEQSWVNDTLQDVLEDIQIKGYAENSDVRIMLLVGETMPKVFRGETTMLQHFRESGLLDEYYASGFGTKQTTIWVAEIVKQLTDRNPHLSFLEIGAGTGGATQTILNAIGQDFDQYTFTDISSSFFENAANKFASHGSRIKYKICNAEIDPVAQGFEAGTYDVIIAFMVVHACASLDDAMRNLRKLLKPGGLLILGEGAADGAMQAGAGFIFGTLSGWWRGVDEGRTLSPLVNVSEWESILKRTGFSGIDTMSPPKLFDAFGITLFVSTAVDPRIEFALEPLSAEHNTVFHNVVLLGGQTTPVAKLVQEIKAIIAPWATKVHCHKTLEELDEGALDKHTKVISLVDLERPVFEDITPQRWYKFRKIFESEKTVLWLTRGRLSDNPYCNMTVGFGRSAMHEEEALRVQYLDVPAIDKVNARNVVERLLRFTATHLDAKEILYTKEPEILVDTAGRERVPRLFPIKEANDRLNSVSRPIYQQVDLTNSVVELQHQGNTSYLRELTRYETDVSLMPQGVAPDTLYLHITHSVQVAIRTPIGHHFLALGYDASKGSHYLALASSLASRLRVSKQSVVAVDDGVLFKTTERSFVALVAAQLMAIAVVDPLFSGQKLVVHNPPKNLAAAIGTQASIKKVDVLFLADDTQDQTPASWKLLPPYLEPSEVAQIIPATTACFVGLSAGTAENQATILSSLPKHCRIETARSLCTASGIDTGSCDKAILGQLLKRACECANTSEHFSQGNSALAVGLDAIAAGKPAEDPLAIVEWSTTSATIPAMVTRFETQRLFKGDRTYWLVGLSGALGISLCDWMIERGVKYLVLTSRNPKIDNRWVEEHERNGVVIQILCCDVTDEAAIKAVHRKIVATLPPIVGLLNGAMVLRDVSVRNMDFNHVTDVIRPKVLGSIHLDRIFENIELDFFVLLSSINCVIGNVGQANYAAANMGMIGVAGNRRKRGLRASVVNVGAIIGVGYITQSDRQLDITVAKTAMMHLSEQDFHQIFAECVEAGHLDNASGPEISTGLMDIVPETINIPPWYSDPKFTRFIINQSAEDADKREQTNSLSISERLQSCRIQQDIFDVVKEAFGAQLRRVLQISSSDDDLMRMRGVELGFDSLISVDIRSWFLKNFQVSIPVLKIMASDVQMSSLVDLTLEELPAELIPQVAPSPISATPSSEYSEGDANSSSHPESRSDSTPSNSLTETTPSLGYAEDASFMKSVSDSISVDWDNEILPPSPDTFLSFPKETPPPKQKPKVVVLTGCSGLLGHHLLNSLLAEPSVQKVICLATRRLSERVANKEIPPPSDRLVYYEGDLTSERFGLSQTEWMSVFAEADAVIHNGSDTSHLKYYSGLRLANVESTRQLVRACVSRRVALHYVSSAGVALFAECDEFPEISCTKTGKKPPADGSHGYMCGKWVCESMLERVHELYPEQRIVIQRPSTIIREGDDAEVAKAGFDWVNALLHYCHKTRCVPRVDHNSGAFDLVSIQTCCNDILRELLREEAEAGTREIVYVNNVGDVVIPMDRMSQMGRDRGQEEYSVVTMPVWAQTVIDAGMHPAVAALIEVFDEPGAEQYPRLLKQKDSGQTCSR